ncbi:MAG: amidohydrolase family protein [Actinomycetota bacterium]
MDRVDTIVRAGTVLTMDAANDGVAPTATQVGAISDGAIAVRDGDITAVGRWGDISDTIVADRYLGGPDDIAIPGLFNCHQHLTGDRLIRSMIPDDLPSGQAIFEWAVPAHAAHRPDDDELSATLSLVEALCNGITYTVEAGTVAHPDRVLDAFQRVGAAGTLGSWGWDVDGEPWAGSVEEVLDRQRAVLELTADRPLVDGWVTLVGHDLMSDKLVAAASELARDHATHLTFHLSPTTSDPEQYLARTGVRPAVHLDRLDALGNHVVIAHGVHLDDEEIEVILQRDTAIAYCPWAYLRLGQGASSAGRHAQIRRRGGRIGLGCDAENASDAIDIMRAATLAAGLAKDTTQDPEALTAHDALAMVTIEGARACGVDALLGSLTVGKRADVVLLDTSGPEWTPRSPDPVLQLIWASDGRCVRDVMIAGRDVVRHGQPVLVDRGDLAVEAQVAHDRLVRDAGLS